MRFLGFLKIFEKNFRDFLNFWGLRILQSFQFRGSKIFYSKDVPLEFVVFSFLVFLVPFVFWYHWRTSYFCTKYILNKMLKVYSKTKIYQIIVTVCLNFVTTKVTPPPRVAHSKTRKYRTPALGQSDI